MRNRVVHNELFKHLHDRHAAVRVAAAQSLGKMKVRRAMKHLARALQDQHPEVRYYAAWALGVIRDPKAFIYLKIAQHDQDANVQRAIQHALSRLAQPTTEALMQRLAMHPHPQTRMQAAQSLGRLGESQALEALVAALHDPSLDVRLAAIRALMCLEATDDPTVFTKVLAVLPQDDPSIRRLVFQALRHLVAGHWLSHEHTTPKTGVPAGHPSQPSSVGAAGPPDSFRMARRQIVKRVLAGLRQERDASVRVEAINTVGHLLGYAAVTEPQWPAVGLTHSVPAHDGQGTDTAFLTVMQGGRAGVG